MIKPITISLLFIFFSFINLKSQDRFKAAAMFGLNLAQIDGDNYEGYHKPGVHFGLRATTVLTEQLNFNIELLFSQKGSKSKAENFSPSFVFKNFDLRLNYIEVPFLFSYRFKYLDKGRKKYSFYRFNGMAGISFARLLGTQLKEILPANFSSNNPPNSDRVYMTQLIDSFNKNDFAVVFGLSYYLSKHVGLCLRHSTSFSNLFRKEQTDNNPSLRMINYFLWAQVFYDF
ncbi:MAG: porin family protein [Saprospiraceae bacterium]